MLPDRPSIAVLPFDNMSDDAEQEYFADGLVEDIITALSRLKWFFVIARNSSFAYKGQAVDVRRVGRELGVQYVLEGSVRRSGNRVRITGQLVDTHAGNHIWVDRFDGDLADIFDLQDRITASVAGAIEPSLSQAEIKRTGSKPTESLTAYDYYLRALALYHKFGPDSVAAALPLARTRASRRIPATPRPMLSRRRAGTPASRTDGPPATRIARKRCTWRGLRSRPARTIRWPLRWPGASWAASGASTKPAWRTSSVR